MTVIKMSGSISYIASRRLLGHKKINEVIMSSIDRKSRNICFLYNSGNKPKLALQVSMKNIINKQ